MKKHIPTITIFIIIIGIIALGIWYSDLPRGKAGKNSPLKQLAKLDVYSKEELSFLEEEGFLDNIDSENLPSNKEQIISLLKSSNLIEQNLNSPDESFEVLATKLGENTYQLAFKLENKSNQSKEFYLIPISESSQTEFKEIRGRISGTITEAHNTPLVELYDVNQHKSELRPELAQAYDDIDNNGYTGKPIKVVLEPNSVLIAQSKWQINKIQNSKLDPIYLLVYGSSAGAMDELYKDISFEKLDKVEKIKEDHFKIKYDKYSEVELGNLETDDFEPFAKLKKWGDETYIKVSYPTTKKIKPKQEDKKLKWKDDKVEVHFYPLDPVEYEENGHTVRQLKNGGFEFEIILKEKPTSNKIVLNIETKGLKFYYQPELTQKEIEMGAFRPENVVGSYAVYHESKAGNYEAFPGGKNYRAGKAFHIYRPKIIDSNGWEVWGELSINEQVGLLTVTINQTWLDNAVYPVIVDPTFGYEEDGASVDADNALWNTTSRKTCGSHFTITENGTGSSITGYTRNKSAGYNIKYAIYDSSLNKIANGETGEVSDGGTGSWASHWTEAASFSTGPSLTKDATYWLMAVDDVDTVNYAYLKYDSGDANKGLIKTVASYAFPDPISDPAYESKIYSIYATYTPEAAEPSVRIKGSTIRIKGAKVKIK